MVEEKLLLDFAMSVGDVMLRNGAETQRVEKTIEIILSTSKHNLMPETFVTPTGIFAGINGPLSGTVTKVKRVDRRTINLEKVSAANSLSRRFVAGEVTLRRAFEEINEIERMSTYSTITMVITHIIIVFSFTLLFSGTLNDALISISVGMIMGLRMKIFMKMRIASFVRSLASSMMATGVVLLWYYFGLTDNYETIIMGAIMPLVPGFAITNGAKDVMYGDFVSGGARMIDAVLTAVFIAAGVGIMLTGYNYLMGGAAL